MKSEKGFSLLEVVIAITLMGIVAVAFLGGLSTASKGIFNADERATAESLARTQMESARNQEYDATNNPPQYAKIPNIPAGYYIAGYDYDYASSVIKAERLDKGNGTANDTGIQKITVIIKHQDKVLVTLEDYRSLR